MRTDFSDDRAWRDIERVAREPVGVDGFLAYLTFLDDPSFAQLSAADALRLARGAYRHGFVVLADATSMRGPDHPVLVVDLMAEPGRAFRAIPQSLQSVENNLSIANMDFAEFADLADSSRGGIFRDFE
ncbi:MAG TPA: hypothetical protein VEU77_04990 [Candidatus Acidoferrales bacterium]|nr:hypothetical protein [Candidatus Acidoferrales bacterium]